MLVHNFLIINKFRGYRLSTNLPIVDTIKYSPGEKDSIPSILYPKKVSLKKIITALKSFCWFVTTSCNTNSLPFANLSGEKDHEKTPFHFWASGYGILQ